jgi:predicted metallopeptidase
MAKRAKYEFEVAPDVQARLEEIVRLLPEHFSHVDTRRVVCFRSRGSRARIYARIWSLPRIWQTALGVEAHYVIEVVRAFDRQDEQGRDETLIHELMHIPKSFSGSLVPHKCFGRAHISCASVGAIYRDLASKRSRKTSSPPSADPPAGAGAIRGGVQG